MRNYSELNTFLELTSLSKSDLFLPFINVMEVYADDEKARFQEIIEKIEKAADALPVLRSSRSIDELNTRLKKFLIFIHEEYQINADYPLADPLQWVMENYVPNKLKEWSGAKRLALYAMVCWDYIYSLEYAYKQNLEWAMRYSGMVEPFDDVMPLILADQYNKEIASLPEPSPAILKSISPVDISNLQAYYVETSNAFYFHDGKAYLKSDIALAASELAVERQKEILEEQQRKSEVVINEGEEIDEGDVTDEAIARYKPRPVVHGLSAYLKSSDFDIQGVTTSLDSVITKSFAVPLGKTLHVKTPLGRRTYNSGDIYYGPRKSDEIGSDPDFVYSNESINNYFDEEESYDIQSLQVMYEWLRSYPMENLQLLYRYIEIDLKESFLEAINSGDVSKDNIGMWVEEAVNNKARIDEMNAAKNLFGNLSKFEKDKVLLNISRSTGLTPEEVTNEIGDSITLADIQQALKGL